MAVSESYPVGENNGAIMVRVADGQATVEFFCACQNECPHEMPGYFDELELPVTVEQAAFIMHVLSPVPNDTETSDR